jgi:hypothetical protein
MSRCSSGRPSALTFKPLGKRLISWLFYRIPTAFASSKHRTRPGTVVTLAPRFLTAERLDRQLRVPGIRNPVSANPLLLRILTILRTL